MFVLATIFRRASFRDWDKPRHPDELGLTSAYPTGAPEGICQDPTLTPIHGRPPLDHQIEPPPYTVIASKRSYQPKDIIPVIIIANTGTTFKGFAVGALDETGHWIGSWDSVKGQFHQLKDCPVVTHDHNLHTIQVTLQWEAPEGKVGDANFVVTVVKNFFTGWTGVPVTYVN